ncbi:hypothetical protein CORC01_00787 [Colletotrichum orchidophilum]|uniref:Uncharacterized protein n=1 Tax=Colletotrichum orchidophilum TaxID=1209926 RepID=A0A1G4BRJ8_9PEZI|nr:uncharacterized protein CORC01_00787 [Colletotrichum orchidophilum]OHF03925.1 hypothetical protein CORC01_00787 [Colletotrichum orchidophilum]
MSLKQVSNLLKTQGCYPQTMSPMPSAFPKMISSGLAFLN